jgi:hypothetical protein
MTAQTQTIIALVWSLGIFALAPLAFALRAWSRSGRGALGLAAPSNGRRLSVASATGPSGNEASAGAPGVLAPVDLGGASTVNAANADDALNVWEGEGGLASPPDFEATDREFEGARPMLPAGHTARLSWGFVDQDGRFAYEFFRVYGPAGRLDPGLSYWAVRARGPFGAEGGAWSGWRMTYNCARSLAPDLTFARFSSPAGGPTRETDSIAPPSSALSARTSR